MSAKYSSLRIQQIIFDELSRRVGTKYEINERCHLIRDLEIDSLAAVELLADMEDYFSVRFPDEALPQMETVGDVIRCISEGLARDKRLSP